MMFLLKHIRKQLSMHTKSIFVVAFCFYVFSQCKEVIYLHSLLSIGAIVAILGAIITLVLTIRFTKKLVNFHLHQPIITKWQAIINGVSAGSYFNFIALAVITIGMLICAYFAQNYLHNFDSFAVLMSSFIAVFVLIIALIRTYIVLGSLMSKRLDRFKKQLTIVHKMREKNMLQKQSGDMFDAYLGTLCTILFLGAATIQGGLTLVFLPLTVILLTVLSPLVAMLVTNREKYTHWQHVNLLGELLSKVFYIGALYISVKYLFTMAENSFITDLSGEKIMAMEVFRVLLVATICGSLNKYTLNLLQNNGVKDSSKFSQLISEFLLNIVPVVLTSGAIWLAFSMAGYYGGILCLFSILSTAIFHQTLDAYSTSQISQVKYKHLKRQIRRRKLIYKTK